MLRPQRAPSQMWRRAVSVTRRVAPAFAAARASSTRFRTCSCGTLPAPGTHHIPLVSARAMAIDQRAARRTSSSVMRLRDRRSLCGWLDRVRDVVECREPCRREPPSGTDEVSATAPRPLTRTVVASRSAAGEDRLPDGVDVRPQMCHRRRRSPAGHPSRHAREIQSTAPRARSRRSSGEGHRPRQPSRSTWVSRRREVRRQRVVHTTLCEARGARPVGSRGERLHPRRGHGCSVRPPAPSSTQRPCVHRLSCRSRSSSARGPWSPQLESAVTATTDAPGSTFGRYMSCRAAHAPGGSAVAADRLARLAGSCGGRRERYGPRAAFRFY